MVSFSSVLWNKSPAVYHSPAQDQLHRKTEIAHPVPQRRSETPLREKGLGEE